MKRASSILVVFLLLGTPVGTAASNLFAPINSAGESCGENGLRVASRNDAGPFLHWATHEVSYFLNQAGSDDLPLSDVLSAIQGSFHSWTSVGADVRFRYRGATNATLDGGDGRNTFFWDENGSVVPRIAYARTFLCYNNATGEIVDSDIAFNGYRTSAFFVESNACGGESGFNAFGIPMRWTIGQQGLQGTTIGGVVLNPRLLADVQTQATHEIGHLLGLAHSNVPGATMSTVQISPIFTCTTEQASLEPDDIEGVRFIYGASQGCNSFLSFQQGNPGVPGDGISITSFGFFDLSTPFPLNGITDGLTFFVFPASGAQTVDAVQFNIYNDRTGFCHVSFGGSVDNTGISPIQVNGVQGYRVILSQSQLQQWLDILNTFFHPGCGITLNELHVDSVFVSEQNPFQAINTIDAASICPGQHSSPTQ